MRISQPLLVCCISALTFACSTMMSDSQYPRQLELNDVVKNTNSELVETRSTNGSTITGCTREQIPDLMSDVALAQVVLDVVLQARHHESLGIMTPSELLDIEHRYFGNVTESLRHYMTEILEVVRNDWDQTQYVCEEVCTGILLNASAYVYSEISGVVHLCENFHLYRSVQYFSAVGFGGTYAPTNGARTILHEKMHLVHHGVSKALSPKYIPPIVDFAYRPLACQQLVHDSPESTFLNADSWASYMSELYVGVKIGMHPRLVHTIVDTPVAGMEVFGGRPAWQRLLHLTGLRDWIASYQKSRNSRTFKNWKSGTEEARNEH